MTLNYPVLSKIMLVISVVSIVNGYWIAVNPYLMIILHESGCSYEEMGIILAQRGIISMILSYGGSTLILVSNYHLGKQYKLGKKSAVVFVLALIIATWIGYLLGYGISQIELPEYPILSPAFFYRNLGNLSGVIIWSFLGMLAGNYKRELEKQHTELNQLD